MSKKRRTVVVAIRIPPDLHMEIMTRVRQEDVDFSKYVRRAVRNELANPKVLSNWERKANGVSSQNLDRWEAGTF